jgi:outer membrane protein assembly factor BamB
MVLGEGARLLEAFPIGRTEKVPGLSPFTSSGCMRWTRRQASPLWSSERTAASTCVWDWVDRDTLSVSLSTPGVVYKDILICGSIVAEDLPAAPGYIRAFDVRTGKSRWSFHTIPHPGELGYETWPPEAWKTSGGVNDWGGLALDAKRGMVFVPTGSPSFDFYARDLRGESSGVYRCSCRRRQRISFDREICCVRAAKLVCS